MGGAISATAPWKARTMPHGAAGTPKKFLELLGGKGFSLSLEPTSDVSQSTRAVAT